MSQDQTFKSTDNRRTQVSGIRHSYRQLDEHEKVMVDDIKNTGQAMWDICDDLPVNRPGQARSVALAKTKIEEAVMWAVHAVTSPEPTDKEHTNG